MRPRVLVAAAWIQDREGRTLFSQRRPGDSFPLHWEFPGGKVRQDETPVEAVVRELKEELGIVLIRPQPWTFVSHDYENFHLLMLVFHCREFQGVPQALQVHRWDWFRPEHMGALTFPPADLPLVAMLTRST